MAITTVWSQDSQAQPRFYATLPTSRPSRPNVTLGKTLHDLVEGTAEETGFDRIDRVMFHVRTRRATGHDQGHFIIVPVTSGLFGQFSGGVLVEHPKPFVLRYPTGGDDGSIYVEPDDMGGGQNNAMLRVWQHESNVEPMILLDVRLENNTAAKIGTVFQRVLAHEGSQGETNRILEARIGENEMNIAGLRAQISRYHDGVLTLTYAPALSPQTLPASITGALSDPDGDVTNTRLQWFKTHHENTDVASDQRGTFLYRASGESGHIGTGAAFSPSFLDSFYSNYFVLGAKYNDRTGTDETAVSDVVGPFPSRAKRYIIASDTIINADNIHLEVDADDNITRVYALAEDGTETDVAGVVSTNGAFTDNEFTMPVFGSDFMFVAFVQPRDLTHSSPDGPWFAPTGGLHRVSDGVAAQLTGGVRENVKWEKNDVRADDLDGVAYNLYSTQVGHSSAAFSGQQVNLAHNVTRPLPAAPSPPVDGPDLSNIT